jgi:CubicO group peptidase (beta-lactamase class C family)
MYFVSTFSGEDHFKPKSEWKYSNSGYIIAGKIVEIVSGQSWDQYIQDSFLKPLKMNQTGYVENFTQVSDVEGHEGQKTVENFNLSWAASAGAFYTTADDLAKWTAIYDDLPPKKWTVFS